MNNILTLETSKYAIRLENFEGPLDLLCHLVDKNKMDINQVNISEITDQYISYINVMTELNLDITSEFVLMASTLLYLKSKSLLPNQLEDEEELTEEQLIQKIIEYKKYKEITKKLRELYDIYSKRFYKLPDKIKLENRKLEENYSSELISTAYKDLIERNDLKVNKHSGNMAQIAIGESVTIASKVKDIFKELLKKPQFIFNKLCSLNKYNKIETVVAFNGILELTRRNKIEAEQEKLFGDIVVKKGKK